MNKKEKLKSLKKIEKLLLEAEVVQKRQAINIKKLKKIIKQRRKALEKKK